MKRMTEAFPELFPPEITHGYCMKDLYHSRKLDITVRRIKIDQESYTIRPSFVMPRMAGKTDDVEKALFLRKFGVPFWALAYAFGHNAIEFIHNKDKSL